ncbi:VOC family protein [Chryseobacterium sp. PMSZPI]|uniref:VOC family protein n=1 Tax=Chryseobacterium sp. PMSZPI TaxID=1033900 RepID=UPI000C32D65E|nr:VOC family protein [Chryseobacterium sp. PMSZPI]PKF73846.1 glyoxalase family protein [Chryseobacterium sp. PMSZPI]
MNSDKYKHHQTQYIELLSEDLDRAKQFYSNSFGWEFKDYGPDYTTASGDYVDIGIVPGKPLKSSILVVLYSNDLNRTKDKIIASGGTIVIDVFQFPGGSRFHFEDPDGNELAVWTVEP